MSEDLSQKMRVYLAEIYRLADLQDQLDGYISTAALSEILDVTAPAVNRMVNRLKELNLLDHQPYQGIRLTPQGRIEALQQLRAHRIAEVFLEKVMGFKWDEVHHEAANMSIALDGPLLARMDEMTNHPTHCPHGEPIPDAEGNLPPPDDMLLSNVAANTHVQVTRMRTRDKDRLRYIEALGLMPGAKLDVLHAAPFNGPMQLKVGGEYRIVGHNLAELIRVKAVS
jgi:DtxR family transcriptional regulator, Mn-dependent transcriptional regulator